MRAGDLFSFIQVHAIAIVIIVSATEVISDGAEGIILESVLEGYA